LRLEWLRAFAAAARDRADLDRLRDLRDGRVVVPDVPMDAELRWQLLYHLVAAGAAEPAEIDAEAHRDPSGLAVRHAARCRAAVPATTAKVAAWDAALDPALPPQTVMAVAEGLMHPGHADLVRPLVDRYFRDVRRHFEQRPGPAAGAVSRALFPSLCVDEATIATATRSLAEGDWPPALRAIVEDGVATLHRAMRCRARDAAAVPDPPR
jgi:aminopeptidase N